MSRRDFLALFGVKRPVSVDAEVEALQRLPISEFLEFLWEESKDGYGGDGDPICVEVADNIMDALETWAQQRLAKRVEEEQA